MKFLTLGLDFETESKHFDNENGRKSMDDFKPIW
jgi:hypothetical protein